MTEEIKYYKEKEYPLKWIPAEEMEETPQQTIARLKQENKELLEARNHFMGINLKYFNALEEIRGIANENNFCASYACPPMFKILDRINEVLGNESN